MQSDIYVLSRIFDYVNPQLFCRKCHYLMLIITSVNVLELLYVFEICLFHRTVYGIGFFFQLLSKKLQNMQQEQVDIQSKIEQYKRKSLEMSHRILQVY